MISNENQKKTKLALPVYLYKEGTNRRAYDFLGCHPSPRGSFTFTLWAPNALEVSLVGDFNNWLPGELPLKKYDSGFWRVTTDRLAEYDNYKFAVVRSDGRTVQKSDPFAFHTETRPGNASKVYKLSGFEWKDKAWMLYRKRISKKSCPLNIYELHVGSWKTYENGLPFSYTKLAEELIPYVKSMGYTHIELLPVSEYPLDDSWGYQVTGYFAPTSRYGEPKEFMYFVNQCHMAGIGVIIDWVGAHFPKDEFGLYEFDGTRLYEYSDDKKAEHPEWQTRIFDFGKGEVRSFLISSVLFWLNKYHVDGVRVDAVTSMLYLDYARKDGEWEPNQYGGNHNLEAIEFLKRLTMAISEEHPDVLTVAEESTSWGGITAPVTSGGLGFDFKWDMGWMHDTLEYFTTDPLFRKYRHELLTFSMAYAFSESYLLPLSHDEVVHGKLSLINKMYGEYDDKFANLRLLFGYMISHPGKKLSFMGNEYGQFIEWDYKKGLDFFLLDYPAHRAFNSYIRDLNFFYLEHSALWENDGDWGGFQWISPDDRDRSIISFRRISNAGEIVAVFNMTPVFRSDYILGVPEAGSYTEVFSSNARKYGGSGFSNVEVTASEDTSPSAPLPFSVKISLPPLTALFFIRNKQK